jgi:hypothetical protein
VKDTTYTVPEILFVAGTRAMLGAGVALLLSDKFSRSQRRSIGTTLFAIGALTTIPAAMKVFGGRPLFQKEEMEGESE